MEEKELQFEELNYEDAKQLKDLLSSLLSHIQKKKKM